MVVIKYFLLVPIHLIL